MVSGASTGSASSGPLVFADHASGKPISGAYCGSCSEILNLERRQLRPNLPQRSMAASSTPNSFSRFTAQFAATVNPGEPVNRGPYTSVSQNKWSMTFEFWKASFLMR